MRPVSPHTASRVTRAASALVGVDGPESRFAAAATERRVEVDAVTELLVAGRTSGLAPDEARPLARAVAVGCLGEQHLWRDMGLEDRALLRELLETYFGPFAEGNDRDMRWKKYIYRKLCRWEGFEACRAPSCGECPTYEECFSPEE